MDDNKPATGADELQAELEHARRQLGETVEALAAKADVKARAQEISGLLGETLAAGKERAVEAGRQLGGELHDPARKAADQTVGFLRKYPAQVLAAAAALAGLVAVRRHRRRG
jgi:ElaB/YqjD/DUF883 family membrane-anchored ribosome-binding protein